MPLIWDGQVPEDDPLFTGGVSFAFGMPAQPDDDPEPDKPDLSGALVRPSRRFPLGEDRQLQLPIEED